MLHISDLKPPSSTNATHSSLSATGLLSPSEDEAKVKAMGRRPFILLSSLFVFPSVLLGSAALGDLRRDTKDYELLSTELIAYLLRPITGKFPGGLAV